MYFFKKIKILTLRLKYFLPMCDYVGVYVTMHENETPIMPRAVRNR